MKVLKADTRLEPTLAHSVVFRRIVQDIPALQGMISRAGTFFEEALEPLSKQPRAKKHRAIAKEALAVWVYWGDLLKKALEGYPEDNTSKRIERSSKCAPACIRVEAEYFRKCDHYPCPMCWFRHVRDRMEHLGEVFTRETVGPILRLHGMRSEGVSAFPARESYNEIFQEISDLRDAINPAGSMMSVCLEGVPGEWYLDGELVLAGITAAEAKEAIAEVGVQDGGMTWRVFEFHCRGQELLGQIVKSLRYPSSLFHKDVELEDIRAIFSGGRLSRSRTTGIFRKASTHVEPCASSCG